MTVKVVYSATILDHFKRPRHAGVIDNPDLAGEANNPLCGDRIRITIRIDDGRIKDVRFHAEACAICTAAASLLMVGIVGQSLSTAIEYDEMELMTALDAAIPAERTRCATLPLEALRGATGPAPQETDSMKDGGR